MLDRFGRVRRHSTSGGSAQSGLHYEYDYAGNRTSRDTIAPTNNVWDQKYAYDGLHRLKDSDQGTLASGSISSPTFEEDYTLDQLGNWENLTKKTGGSTTLNQDRTHNAANEMQTVDVWQNPAHDAAGNMTIGK